MTAEDRRLTDLLHAAGDSLEPSDQLATIRARVAAEGTQRRRRTWWAAGGASLATAAAVAAVALASGFPGSQGAQHEVPAGGTTTIDTPPPGPTDPGPSGGSENSPSSGSATTAVPVYYAGDTPLGPRLYREFQPAPADLAGDAEAARRAISGEPLDSDYRSLWPSGDYQVSTEWAGHQSILVDVRATGLDLTTRPADLSPAEARLAIQQVVFAVQGALGERLPVQILLDGETASTVLGVPMDVAIRQDPEALALVNVTTPESGQRVTDRLEASGLANSFEATVPWQILNANGQVVDAGSAMASGAYDRLYPWSTSIDVSRLAPGDYVFVARTDDPSGGAGPGPFEDSKDFRVG